MNESGVARVNAPLFRRISQFYSRQIKAVAASVVAFFALYSIASHSLYSIPRDGFATVATMFATLLGLTFAAFSVMTALMPAVPRSFLRTRTFLMFGQTFVFTMWLQLFTVLVAGLCYLGFGDGWVPGLGVAMILSSLLSVTFLLVVVHYMLFSFKLVRKHLSGDGSPESVL